MKTCTLCRQTKPLAGFPRSRRSRDGLSSRCRECNVAETRRAQARQRARLGDEEYLRRRRAMVRRYRSDPAKRERNRAINRAQTRALFRLAERHPEEYDELLTAERVVEGLPAIRYDRRPA
jgi:hypothetical protein